jgi:hypothetical protein
VARDAAIAERDSALVTRGEEVSHWRRQVSQRDARIDELDGVATHLSRLVIQRERELDALRGQVDEVLESARGYATRVRMDALRQAATIAGSGNGNGSGPHAAERDSAAETAAAAPESTFGVRPAAPADLFEGVVQLEIGPLADFSQLVGFEDAAGAIAATSEVSVTRFSKGRASLDLRLSEPVDLLRELEERAPFGFRVRSVRDGRLILDLGEESEAAA